MGNARNIPDNPKAIFLPYQNKWIKDNSRLKLMEKARQIGLSWSTAYTADERTAVALAKHDTWVSSRDDLQARLFIEDCKMWAKILSVAAKDLGEIVVDDKKNTAFVLQFANGKRIHSLSSNADAQAGKRGSRILDEFALHPNPRNLWSIAYPGITWGGQFEVISTHRGSQNFFNELVREIKEKGNPKQISLHTVTLQQALEQGFLYKLQQALPADDQRQTMNEAEYFDFIKSGCADEESFQQEYCCNPADDNSAFLEYDLIASCEYADNAEGDISFAEFVATAHQRSFYGGLDIGRTHDLTVLWIFEKLGDTLYTRKVITLKNMPKPDQEKVLHPWLEPLRRCCFDYTGLGIGWGDDAQRKFGKYKIELITFTGQIKEEMAFGFRGRFEDKTLRIPYDPAIRADLRAVKKQVTSSGNIRFVAESSEAGHADRFWAGALGNHAASGNQGVISFQPINIKGL